MMMLNIRIARAGEIEVDVRLSLADFPSVEQARQHARRLRNVALPIEYIAALRVCFA